jgi:hypothetical protein
MLKILKRVNNAKGIKKVDWENKIKSLEISQ